MKIIWTDHWITLLDGEGVEIETASFEKQPRSAFLLSAVAFTWECIEANNYRNVHVYPVEVK